MKFRPIAQFVGVFSFRCSNWFRITVLKLKWNYLHVLK